MTTAEYNTLRAAATAAHAAYEAWCAQDPPDAGNYYRRSFTDRLQAFQDAYARHFERGQTLKWKWDHAAKAAAHAWKELHPEPRQPGNHPLPKPEPRERTSVKQVPFT